jgi:hypothetical protein
VEHVVYDCFEEATLLSYDDIHKKLRYIPFVKIKRVLAYSDSFISVRNRIYTLISKIIIEPEEIDTIEHKIIQEVKANGFIDFEAIDVSKIYEHNPELSENVIIEAIYKMRLADKYTMKWYRIFLKEESKTDNENMKQFCLSKDSLTINEIINHDINHFGRNLYRTLSVAYKHMIRINADIFIKDDIVFYIDKIDDVIESYMSSDVIPLKSIKVFTSFPVVKGHAWNRYLLESYCLKYSEKFIFGRLTASNQNIGAIDRASSGFESYLDALAYAVVEAKIDLKEKVVGDFLFDNGYIGARTSSVRKVIDIARVI